MNLIAILICVVIQKTISLNGFIDNTIWLNAYIKKIQPRLKNLNNWLGLAAMLAPFFIVLTLLHLLSFRHLFGLLHLLLTVAILFFCIDFREIGYKLTDYFEASENSKTDQALPAADAFIHTALGNKKSRASVRTISKAVFTYAFEWIFAPLFWFLVLDIYGVVLYVLISNISKKASQIDSSYEGIAQAATKVQELLDFLPMRIVALTYTLAGHFTTGFAYCYKKVLSLSFDTQDFVVNTALASLGPEYKHPKEESSKENRVALSLVNRTILIWLIGLVLFTLGSMMA